jgi:holliday junction DNA helicase RuvA
VISQVRGTLVERGMDRVELLTAGGVAYLVHIPLTTVELLPRVGEPVTLHTALVVRDDAWELYGFSSPDDRALFQLLRSASGVGPALALSLLSALSPSRLVAAIRGRDIPTLQRVPRVGKKTAERLCVELGDKLGAWSTIAGGADPGGAVSVDAVRALVALGYGDADAERAVASAMDAERGAGPAELIKRALATLQGR